jgi:two-component system, NtrC family, sensor kinase
LALSNERHKQYRAKPMRQVEAREWWLWGLAVTVTLVLTTGIVSLTLSGPLLIGNSEWFDLKEWARGLACLVLLFDIYTVYQQLQLQRIRRELTQRNQLFEVITENAADMIAVTDCAGNRLYNSPAYQKVLGYSVEELKVTSPVEQIHPEDRQRVLEAAEKARLTGRGERLDYRIRHKDGTWRVLESVATAIPNEEGHTERLVTVNRDVTERKSAEETNNRSDQLFRSIAENSADLIAVVDNTGHRIYNNPTYERLLGYTQEELKRTNSFQQIHPDDRAMVARAAQQALETGIGQIVEYRMQRKDGTYVTLESHGSVIRDSRGEIEASVISARDISHRRMAMQTEKLSAIGNLAAGIAHEINTPVQYVSDNIAFLSDVWNQLDAAMAFCLTPAHASIPSDSRLSVAVTSAAPPEDWDWLRQEVPKAIAQSIEGIRRMSKILGAMRRFSHTGGGEREQVDLNEALDATLTIAQNQIKHIADVQTDYQPNLPPIECYADEMNQVFLNLIVNATHAICAASKKQARERGKLTIRTRQIDNDVQIEIRDNGTGIPLPVCDRVFDPFFTTKQAGEGTGQGLTICHNIVVQKHHGNIWFDTEVDRGTTFFIRIPIQFDSDPGVSK